MRQFYAGAEWDVLEVRDLRGDDGVFVMHHRAEKMCLVSLLLP